METETEKDSDSDSENENNITGTSTQDLPESTKILEISRESGSIVFKSASRLITVSPLSDSFMSPEEKEQEIDSILLENQRTLERLKVVLPAPNTQEEPSYLIPHPITTFEEFMQELTVEMSVEKATHIRLGFTRKANAVHLIQSAIMQIFSTMCETTKENGVILKLIMQAFSDDYFRFILEYMSPIFKYTKPILDAHFENDCRELSHEFLKHLFETPVELKNVQFANFNWAGQQGMGSDIPAVFSKLYISVSMDSPWRTFSEYIYKNIERAIEQRFVLVAYTLIYLYNSIMQVTIHNQGDFFTNKGIPSRLFNVTVSGLLITYTQSVVRYLFSPLTRFEHFFPGECVLIIQSTVMAEKINNPSERVKELKRLTSKKPANESQESSSGGFFSFFKGSN